jgi:hypothetical protein
MDHSLLEPLCYPLFFPWGSGGWGSQCSIPFVEYLCCRLLMPDRIRHDDEFENADVMVKYLPKMISLRNRYIPVNRFQCLSQLGQIYFTDMISRSIDRRLEWHKRNQHIMLGPNGRQTRTRLNQNDLNDDDHSSGDESFLSQSFHGSRRHLRKLSTNALTIVSEYNKPTLFITLTCNPLWPEIQEMLLPGQTPFNRPDIVCRIFYQRLKSFLNNIRNGKYFDDFDKDGEVTVRREVIYELRVIEYQHRGLPHAHLIYKFSNTPESNESNDCSNWIDQHISCELPVLDEFANFHDQKYFQLVNKHMKHTCANAVNGCLDQNNHCKKGFMDTTLQNQSSFDERGYVKYKRTKPSDLRIGPHNRKILEDWDGHAYVDWCGSTYTVLYLYKYLYKGAKKVKFRLENADDIDDKDEISLYIRGRYLCSMDATWRILGYQV